MDQSQRGSGLQSVNRPWLPLNLSNWSQMLLPLYRSMLYILFKESGTFLFWQQQFGVLIHSFISTKIPINSQVIWLGGLQTRRLAQVLLWEFTPFSQVQHPSFHPIAKLTAVCFINTHTVSEQAEQTGPPPRGCRPDFTNGAASHSRITVLIARILLW